VSGHDIIVIGASAGGLQALKQMVACLPRELPAACFVVLHRPLGRDGEIPSILSACGTLPAKFCEDGEPIRRGVLYVAPSSGHLVLEEDRVRISAGPRENFWRPSIDVLFRTAAVAYRTRVVGVVLSGSLDDGVAGLAAVRACGGEALVQHPEEASFSEMPTSALRLVQGARSLPLLEVCREITRLANSEACEPPAIPPELELEARVSAGESDLVSALAMADEISLYNCPECGGPLAVRHDQPLRYRCIVGHGFAPASLQEGLRRQLESSLWVAIRLLQQRSNLSRALAEKEREKGRLRGAQSYLKRAEEDSTHSDVLRKLLMRLSATTAHAVSEELS
jgi:two-component system, chemotaxis family, protein-glutamate methylesterase/glutaminase